MQKARFLFSMLVRNFCKRQINAASRKMEFSDALGQALLAAVRKEEEEARLRVIRCSPVDVSVNMQKAMEAKRGLQEAEKLAKKWREEAKEEYRERCLKIISIRFNYIEFGPARRLRCIFR
jgi:hypothetical protein